MIYQKYISSSSQNFWNRSYYFKHFKSHLALANLNLLRQSLFKRGGKGWVCKFNFWWFTIHHCTIKTVIPKCQLTIINFGWRKTIQFQRYELFFHGVEWKTILPPPSPPGRQGAAGLSCQLARHREWLCDRGSFRPLPLCKSLRCGEHWTVPHPCQSTLESPPLHTHTVR